MNSAARRLRQSSSVRIEMLVNEVLGEEMDLYYRLHAIVSAAYLTRSRSELARHLMRVDCCARARVGSSHPCGPHSCSRFADSTLPLTTRLFPSKYLHPTFILSQISVPLLLPVNLPHIHHPWKSPKPDLRGGGTLCSGLLLDSIAERSSGAPD